MFVDSHVHLDVPHFDADRSEVIERARAADIEMMLEIAGSQISDGSLDAGLALTREYSFIYAAVGVHPHEASLYDDNLERRLLAMSEEEKVIGWGEIGLDYYYDNSPREIQRRVFRRQLELALDRNLPVIIHTRDAEEDTIEILRESGAGNGVIHCFTGTEKLASATIEMGFYISFSGVLTFKKAQDLQEIARTMPIDRILVETDCPYLSPVPYRGKRNEPAFVRETAAKLAEIRGVGIDEIALATTRNFKRLFRLH
jgi:TatD DNase family protein